MYKQKTALMCFANLFVLTDQILEGLNTGVYTGF